MKKIFSHHADFNSVIRHFTPNWFAVNMGTGITALCLGNIPWQNLLLHSVATGIWLLNSLIFMICLLIWLANLCLYPGNQLLLLKNNTLPFFLGCLPMAFTTCINGLITFGVPLFGNTCVNMAHSLWFINTSLSLAVVFAVPYFMFIHQDHSLESMTAIWLLPFVAAEVSASSAGLIAANLAPHSAMLLLIAGYMLWGISLPLAFAIIVLLLQRMSLHKLPPKTLGATIWLPLGPIATGALGLLTLGGASVKMLQNGADASWLIGLEHIGIIGAIILLGFSTWIAMTALIITCYYAKAGITFNMSFWSFTFPLGVYTLAMLDLSKAISIPFFEGYGTLLTITLTGVWFWVSSKTLPGLIRGHLINNPLL